MTTPSEVRVWDPLIRVFHWATVTLCLLNFFILEEGSKPHKYAGYAVGILLYEMLTGQRPFVGKNPVAIIQQQLVTPPPPMNDRAPEANIPADLEALVMRLLAKQPAQRFQTPDELIAAIMTDGPSPLDEDGPAEKARSARSCAVFISTWHSCLVLSDQVQPNPYFLPLSRKCD